jgi:hypothetical protein
MIKSLKLFASCVASLRTAEKAYESDPTAFNKRIVTDLQNKVDGWLLWVQNQPDSGLVKDVPPFIGRARQQFRPGVENKDIMQRLMETHTPEEIEKFTKLMQGNL